MLTRYCNWPSRLSAYLSAHRDTSFRYGTFDCCLFTCDAIEAMTGYDVAAGSRGSYSTRKGAMEAIRERTGGRGTVRAFAEHTAAALEMLPVAVAMAQRGDMVLVGSASRAALGIVSLSGLDVLCARREGIVRVDLKHVTAAWRV